MHGYVCTFGQIAFETQCRIEDLGVSMIKSPPRFVAYMALSCAKAHMTPCSTSSTMRVGVCAGGPSSSLYTPVRTKSDFHPWPFAPAISDAGLSDDQPRLA